MKTHLQQIIVSANPRQAPCQAMLWQQERGNGSPLPSRILQHPGTFAQFSLRDSVSNVSFEHSVQMLSFECRWSLNQTLRNTENESSLVYIQDLNSHFSSITNCCIYWTSENNQTLEHHGPQGQSLVHSWGMEFPFYERFEHRYVCGGMRSGEDREVFPSINDPMLFFRKWARTPK